MPVVQIGKACSHEESLSSSKKQLNRTTSRDLTRTTRLSMLGLSPARGGVVYTGRLADYRPSGRPTLHRGPVWGATASVGGGLPAAVADPAGPRAGEQIFHHRHLDTKRALCDYHVWSEIRNDVRWAGAVCCGGIDRSSAGELISSRVEETHKTSREPNGRTREEGSDDRGNPRRGSRTNSGAAFLSSRPRTGLAWRHGLT